MNKDTFITVRINAGLKNRLKAAAADNDVSLSVLVEFLAKKFLETYYGCVEENNDENERI